MNNIKINGLFIILMLVMNDKILIKDMDSSFSSITYRIRMKNPVSIIAMKFGEDSMVRRVHP